VDRVEGEGIITMELRGAGILRDMARTVRMGMRIAGATKEEASSEVEGEQISSTHLQERHREILR
jgi:hypothetical protein